MNPFKSVKVPVSSHGLHKHDVSCPRNFTTNFFEHLPVYTCSFEKGEGIDINYNFYSRLQPLPVPALVTGRYAIRGYYVPMEAIWKPWYSFKTKTSYTSGSGTTYYPRKARYCNIGLLSKEFISNSNLVTNGSSSNFDIEMIDVNNVASYWLVTPLGAAALKLLNALGISLSWFEGDTQDVNMLYFCAWTRVMLDHYYPRQYVNNTAYDNIYNLLMSDDTNSAHISEASVYNIIIHLFFGFYENGVLDSAWDNPVAPNVSAGISDIKIDDASLYSPGDGFEVHPSSSDPYRTPLAEPLQEYSVVTQFILDALQSVNNFVRRHNLSGSRVIENYLTQHGVSLPDTAYTTSYKLDSYNIPFEISAVENNSQAVGDLGELAGKGVVSSSDQRLRFKDKFKQDGVFIIMQIAIPDSDTPVYVDPFNLYTSALDFYNGAYDKLGPEAVPSRCLFQNSRGSTNMQIAPQVFGFLNRYYPYAMDCPLVFGDYRIIHRGSEAMWSYMSYRNIAKYLSDNGYNLGHSYDFLRVVSDHTQYRRLFYDTKDLYDTMICTARITGTKLLRKLPLGDSFDWDDDEFNEKVSVLTSGSDA